MLRHSLILLFSIFFIVKTQIALSQCNPSAPEIPANGMDEDCDGFDDLFAVLPPVLYATEGQNFEIYFRNIFLSKHPQDYVFTVNTVLPGNSDGQKWSLTPSSNSIGAYALSIAIKSPGGQTLATVNTTLRISPNTMPSDVEQKRLVLFGHSFFDQGYLPKYIRDLTQQSGNPPIVYHGKKASWADPLARYEGLGAVMARQIANGPNSPVIYGGKVNFRAYFDEVVCPGCNPDWLVFHLDINDFCGFTSLAGTTLQEIDDSITNDWNRHAGRLIDSMRVAAPNMKIAVCLSPPPNARESAFSTTYGGNPVLNNRWRWQKIISRLTYKIIARYAQREQERVFVIPENVDIDDFSEYNPSDARHPDPPDNNINTHCGYNEIAKSIYAWIRWVEHNPTYVAPPNSGNLTLVCPANVTVNAAQGTSNANGTFNLPNAASTCPDGQVLMAQINGLASGSAFPLGTSTLRFRATDGCGNLQTCSFTVSVNNNGGGGGNPDCTAASIATGPNSIIINGLTAPVTQVQVFTPQWTQAFNCAGNCPANSLTVPNLSPGQHFVKVNFYTANWQPICQKEQFVTVSSSGGGNLTLTCPGNISGTAPAGANGANIIFSMPTATSTCQTGTVSIVQTSGPASGAVFPIGTTNVVFQATDACGNAKTCSFSVTINPAPTTTLTLTCPGNISGTAPAGANGASIIFSMPTATSTCQTGTVSIVQTSGPASGAVFPIGTTSVVFQATDACGNVKTCSFSVAIAPPNSNPDCNAINIAAGAGSIQIGGLTAPVTLIQVFNPAWIKIYDCAGNCPAPSINIPNLPNGTYFVKIDFYNATWQPICQKEQFVEVASGPTGVLSLACPANITTTAPAGANSATVTYPMPTAGSTCPGGLVSLIRTAGLASGAQFPIGSTNIVFQATDGCGNSQACAFSVTVAAPVQTTLSVTCPANITVAANAGAIGATVNYNQPTVSSTCTSGPISLARTGGLASGSFFPIGVTTVVYRATDACSNSRNCAFTVTVLSGPCVGNLALNPNFANNLSRWTTTNCSVNNGQARICEGNGSGFQSIAATAGKTYSAKVFSRISSPGGTAKVVLRFLDAAGQLTGNEISKTVNTSSFQTYTNAGTAPAGTTSLQIRFEKNGGNNCFYVDDWCVTETGAAPRLLARSLPFSATRHGDAVALQWISPDFGQGFGRHFMVERAGADKIFEPIFSSESVQADYSEMDESPLPGDNFYRLQMFQPDGTHLTSETQRVVFPRTTDFAVFPNPASRTVSIQFAKCDQAVDLQVFNLLGKLVFAKTVSPGEPGELIIGLDEWPSGAYSVMLKRGGERTLVRTLLVSSPE